MKQSLLFIVLFSSLLIILSNTSFADRKYFTRSYLAYTLPRGAMELELWNTMRIGKTVGYYYRFQPRFEIEYGATDRFTTSFYMNFNQVTSADNIYNSSPFEFSSTSLEFRYRLTNPDDIFIDPALYFEFSYGGSELEYEPKFILSKRINDFVMAMNINAEVENNVIESELESKFEVTAGLAYEVSNLLAVGIEFRNQRNYLDFYKSEENQATFLGPTINIQTEELYFTINLLKQISGSPSTRDHLDLDGHENFEIRTILGINL